MTALSWFLLSALVFLLGVLALILRGLDDLFAGLAPLWGIPSKKQSLYWEVLLFVASVVLFIIACMEAFL